MAEDALKVRASCVDGVACVLASGDLDLLSAPEFTDHVRGLLTHRPRHLVLDLVRLDYIDSTGIQALLKVHREAIAQDVRTAIHVGAGSSVRRVLRIVGVDQVLCLVDEERERPRFRRPR